MEHQLISDPQIRTFAAEDTLLEDTFVEELHTAVFPGSTRKDFVQKVGFNAQTNDPRAGLWHQLESFYAPNANEAWMEYHLNARGKNNVWTHRPFQVNVSEESGYTNTLFKTDALYVQSRTGVEWLSIPMTVNPPTLFVGLPLIVNAKPFRVRLPGTTLNGVEIDPATRDVRLNMATRVGVSADAANGVRPAFAVGRPGRREAAVKERRGVVIEDQASPVIGSDGKLDKVVALDIEAQRAAVDAIALRTAAGRVEFGDDVHALKGVVLKSPNGSKWRLVVGDDGALSTEAVTS